MESTLADHAPAGQQTASCYYCGRPEQHASANGWIVDDHVVPRCRGGGRAGNLVPACHSCNSSKSGTALAAWLAGLFLRLDARDGRNADVVARCATFVADGWLDPAELTAATWARIEPRRVALDREQVALDAAEQALGLVLA